MDGPTPPRPEPRRRVPEPGRTKLVAALNCPPGATVLDIHCGDGRTLEMVSERWNARLFGIDPSETLLDIARANKLDAQLAQADPAGFDAGSLFDGQASFDRVSLCYALSATASWRDTLAQAGKVVAPGGSLHILDHGELEQLPGFAKGAFGRWLRRAGVEPRPRLERAAQALAALEDMRLEVYHGPLGTYRLLKLSRVK